MSSRPTDDDEAKLAWILSQFQDRQDDAQEPQAYESLEAELDDLSVDELEELVDGNDCLRLLQDLSQLGNEPEGSDASPSSLQGTKIGKYTVSRRLGSGGFADVYFATDTRLDREVALKVLKDRYADDIDVVRRFEREGHAAAALAHPAIIPIYEAGRDGDKTFIAMQHCRGGDLREYLANRKSPLSVQEAAQIGLTISEAIGLAHSKSIVHRDIKPANILLVEPISEANDSPSASIESLLRVSDFGLVKETTFDPDLTSDGVHESAIGTPAYMSPEQTDGANELTPASDVFSIGLVLYELLTGVNPHRKDSRSETFRAIESEPTKSPRSWRAEIDADLEAIVLTCLSKSPSGRYPSAMQLADDLDRWSQGKPVEARPPNSLERTTRWCRRNPAIAASLFVAVASLLLGTFVSTSKWQEAVRQQQVANKANEQANQERAKAEKSELETDSLLQVVFETIAAVDPSQGGDARVNAGEVIRRTKAEIDAKLPSPTEKKWELLRTLAETADGTGDYRLGSELWEEATNLAEQLWGEKDIRILNCLAKQSAALRACGELVSSLQLQSKLLACFQDRFGEQAPETFKAMADLLALQLESGRTGFAIETDGAPEDLPAGTIGDSSHGAISEAIDLLERHIEWTKNKLGDTHESIVPAQMQLADLHFQLGNRANAVSGMRTAIDLATSLFGELDARTLKAKTSLAFMVNRRNATRAVEIMTELGDLAEQRYPASHPVSLRIQHALGICLWKDKQPKEAIKRLSDAQKVCLESHGPLQPDTLSITQSLTRILRLDGAPQQAHDLAMQIVRSPQNRVGPTHRGYTELEYVAGQSLIDMGKLNEAKEIFQRLAESSPRNSPTASPLREKYIGSLWLSLVATEQPEEAIKWIDQFLDDSNAMNRGQLRLHCFALANKTLCLIQLNRWQKAKLTFESFISVAKRRTSNHIIGKALRACFTAKSGSAFDAENEMRAALTQLKDRGLTRRRSYWITMERILGATIDVVSQRGETEVRERLRKLSAELSPDRTPIE